MLNKTPLTDSTLLAAYHRFNHAYFDGRLSKYIAVRFATSRKDRKRIGRAIAIFIPSGTIMVNTRYQHSRRLVLASLLHEMVHAKTWRRLDAVRDDCDLTKWNSFNKESLRIAKMGAFNGLW